MPFKESDCIIPELWCGDGPIPNKKGKRYLRAGTRSECVKKGFGAGMFSEKAKELKENSLCQIKYVGETYEKKFSKKGIKTTDDLLRKMETNTRVQIEKILKGIFKRGGNAGLDQRAYNSTLMYLYNHGVGHLPACSKI